MSRHTFRGSSSFVRPLLGLIGSTESILLCTSSIKLLSSTRVCGKRRNGCTHFWFWLIKIGLHQTEHSSKRIVSEHFCRAVDCVRDNQKGATSGGKFPIKVRTAKLLFASGSAECNGTSNVYQKYTFNFAILHNSKPPSR